MKALITICLLVLPLLSFAGSWEISKIHFSGVSWHGEEKLSDIVQSEEGDRFEARLVKLDRILITNYYRKAGFLDVEVQDSIHFGKKHRTVQIYYKLTEGQRYYYGGVRTEGNHEISSRDLALLFDGIKQYAPFNEGAVNDAVKEVENKYYNSGKPYASVDVRYQYVQDSLIVVALNITENETVYIQKIRYQGLKDVKKFLIRRELTFKIGDRYDRSKIERAQRNLYGSGLFKYVRFEMEPLTGQKGKVTLNIQVQEKDPRWIGAYIGVAHEQEAFYGNKLEFTVQGGHRNLFGTARSISLHITPSLIYDFDQNKLHNPNNKIALQFVEPWILATRTPGVFQTSYEQYRPLNSGSFDLWQTTFNIKKQVNQFTEFTGSLSAKRVYMLDNTAIKSSLAEAERIDQNRVYALTFYWKRDNRKNLFDPHSSSYTDVSLSFSYSTGLNTGGETVNNNYVLLNASWQRYMPWRPKVPGFKRGNFTFATRLKTGMIIEPGTKGLIPINDLLFAGGASSVRGYGEQLLGPAAAVDKDGKITQAAGGKFLFLGNAEGRIPLFWLFTAEIFVDGGYVWPEVADFNVKDFKFTSGAGLVFMSPLGPIRFDFGYKLIPDKTDPAPYAYHFGIYFAF